MSLLSDVVVTFLSSIMVLTAKGQILDCVTTASVERCVFGTLQVAGNRKTASNFMKVSNL